MSVEQLTQAERQALRTLGESGLLQGVWESMTMRYFDLWCKEQDSFARGTIYHKKQVLEDVRREFNKYFSEAVLND